MLQSIEIGKLEPNPFQPRRHFDEGDLKRLADSIRASGMLQPILARQAGDRFQIVAGERRWRAAQLAGLAEVPILVRQLTDQDSALFALVENLQREDLNAIDKAEALRKLLDQLGATQEQVAKHIGLERSTVTNFLRLLELPADVQAHVSRGTLSMGHARALLALPDGSAQSALAAESIRQGWSVRILETKTRQLAKPAQASSGTKGAARSRPIWLNELEEGLVESLGTPVKIRYGRKRSQIIIECAGREEFERIFQRLKNA